MVADVLDHRACLAGSQTPFRAVRSRAGRLRRRRRGERRSAVVDLPDQRTAIWGEPSRSLGRPRSRGGPPPRAIEASGHRYMAIG